MRIRNPLDTTLTDTSEAYCFREMYDTTQTRLPRTCDTEQVHHQRKGDRRRTSKYSLGFNVVEGSVQVLLDGRPLVQNVDYTVDYIIGEVVIRNERALVPGANLQIKYEQNDLFQLASKTLLGARGDIALAPKTNFGFTVHEPEPADRLSDKVRLGEEPNNNTIFGVDGATTFDLPFLTRALDALPLLQTRELSTLRVTGEAAYMLPDPNTRKSPIPSDNGEGIAYIDDFEGRAERSPSASAIRSGPSPVRPADSLPRGTPTALPPMRSIPRRIRKAKIVWFNRLPTDVRLTDVYPRKQPGRRANDQITVMDLHYFPRTAGQFNYSPDLAARSRRPRTGVVS